MACTIPAETVEQVVSFHGHWCPGLALGVRVAEAALQEVGASTDEEVVALVESDMCAVDAVQFLVSCTFGKGNLKYEDHGKVVFSFWRRKDGKGVRIARKATSFEENPQIGRIAEKRRQGTLTEEENELWHLHRAEKCRHIMEAPLEDLFSITPLREAPPAKAVIEPSILCDICGEPVMASRLQRREDGKNCCKPCKKKEAV